MKKIIIEVKQFFIDIWDALLLRDTKFRIACAYLFIIQIAILIWAILK